MVSKKSTPPKNCLTEQITWDMETVRYNMNEKMYKLLNFDINIFLSSNKLIPVSIKYFNTVAYDLCKSA